MNTADHYLHSSLREKLIEHLFVGAVLRKLWCRGFRDMEVLTPQVDDGGYDVAIQCGSILRHIQLKSAHHRARTARVNVHARLSLKSSGCLVWIIFNEETLELGPFRWFGGLPGKELPILEGLKTARHAKGNASGYKAGEPNLRVLPRTKFQELSSIDEVVDRLFGPQSAMPRG